MPTGNNVGGSTAATTTTTTTQACAACKYQRKKCSKGCLLAPYFPHDRHEQFLNAHRLFGVSNITKMIRDLGETQRDIAMRTIVFQADVRAHDPVGGCFRIVRELQYQIECSTAELNSVLQQLAVFRTRAQERQELSQGFSYIPEQPWDVANYKNLQDQNMQQSLVMECNYDDDDDDCEKKKMEVRMPSEIHDVKLEQEENPEQKPIMASNQLLISS